MTYPVPSPDLVTIATRIVAALTGWRWTYPSRHVVEKYRVAYGCQTVSLWGRPVNLVNSVVDHQGEALEFELSNGFQLFFPHWWGGSGLWIDSNYPPSPYLWPNMFPRPGFTTITVDYVYGSPPPLDIQRAISQLAQELALAECNMACQLPERVTSVSREGISYTVLDPQDFLDNGRTGLYFVDLVIKMYVGTKSGTKIYSPEMPPPRRLSSVVVTDDMTVTDNGDGSMTLTGSAVTLNGDGTATVDSSQLTDNGDGTMTATS